MVASFHDTEFGTVQLRYHPRATSIRFRYTPAGTLVITAPPRTPKFLLKQTLNLSRQQIRQLHQAVSQPLYRDGQEIGKSHRLVLVATDSSSPLVTVANRAITVQLPGTTDPTHPDVQDLIRSHVTKVLRKEAHAYLTRRLRLLSQRHGYRYQKIRFSHASSRWGSCSSNGTISLNIGLMSIPLDLIDYVLIHELCHTVEMNHSKAFWRRVEAADPHYQLHRKQMKQYSPHV